MAPLRLYNCTASYAAANECISILGDNSESGGSNPWEAALQIVDFRGSETDELKHHEIHRYYTIRPVNLPREEDLLKSMLSEQTRTLKAVTANPPDDTKEAYAAASCEQILLLCWVLVDGSDDRHAFAQRVRTAPQKVRHPNPVPQGTSAVSVPGHDGYYVLFEDMPKPELEECVVGFVSIQPSKSDSQTGDLIVNRPRSTRSLTQYQTLSRLISRLRGRKDSRKFNAGPACEMMRLYVKQEHHKCLAYALVDTIITAAKAMGFATMVLKSTSARGLEYAKEIFEKAGSDPSDALAVLSCQQIRHRMPLNSPNPSAVRTTAVKYGDGNGTEICEMILAQWPGPLDAYTAAKVLRRKRQKEEEERESEGHLLNPRETGRQCGPSSFFSNRTKPYEYYPLDEDAHEIRLLTLLPGPPDSEIRISLGIHEMYRHGFSKVLRYEALSYSWGSTDNPVPVFIGRSQETIPVTHSLAEALLHLRDRDEPRHLWIDAICIDQANLLERGSQIKRMADLYKNAHRVIVWLGPGLSQSSEAIRILTSIGGLVNVNWFGHTLEDYHEPLPESPNDDSTHGSADMSRSFRFCENDFSCLADLLSRSWFERLWIWQEIRLASPSESIVQCGFDSMSWTHFSNAIFLLRHSKISSDFETKANSKSFLDNRIELAYRICDIGVEDAQSLFEMTRHSKCSDPRDRIYSLLSLFDESGTELKAEPDYTKTKYEVYRDATLRLLLNLGKLNILASSELQGENETGSRNSWNTWVPDWSQTRSTRPVSRAFAAHLSHAEISQHDQTIRVAGVALNEICDFCAFDPAALHPHRLSDVEPIEEQNKATRNNLFRIIEYFSQEQPLTPADIASICRTFIAGEDTESANTANLNSSVSYRAMRDIVDSLLETQQSNSPLKISYEHEGHILKHVLSYCEGRSIVRLRSGSFGFVPRAAREDDVVVAFLGCDHPLVLRPTGSAYRIVGEAYCDGSMNGETLLGPLPTNQTGLLQYDGETSVFIRNALKTGELVLPDPRLGELHLLPGWRKITRKSQPLQAYQLYRNRNDDGEPFFKHDPGLTSSWLRERGVDVQTFEIL